MTIGGGAAGAGAGAGFFNKFKRQDEEALKKITRGDQVNEITCGLQMSWYEEGLKVHQKKYIQSVLKKNGMEDCNPTATILPVNEFQDLHKGWQGNYSGCQLRQNQISRTQYSR